MDYRNITMGELDAMPMEAQREYARWLWRRWSGNATRSTDRDFQLDHRDALVDGEREIGEQP